MKKLKKVICWVLVAFFAMTGITSLSACSEMQIDDAGSSQISGIVSDGGLDAPTDTTPETSSKIEDMSSQGTVSNPSSSKPSQTQSTACSHTETTIKNKSDATCTKPGYSGDTYCNSCNKVIKKGSQIKATGHKTEVRNKKSATTTSTGYTGDTYCAICDVKTATGEVIPKIKDDSKQETNSKTVYITKTGKKYHSRESCTGLNNAKEIYKSTLSEAERKGLTPCSKCH